MLRFRRSRARKIRVGASAPFLTWAPPGHYYSPVPGPDDVERALRALDPVPRELPGIDVREAEQLALLRRFAGTYPELPFPRTATPGARYHLDNPFFAQGDGVALYSMLRWLAPARIVEVGSGFSSAAMLDVRDRFLPGMHLDFVEPEPARLSALLRPTDLARCRIHPRHLQDLPLDPFLALGSNDVLFVDGSHVAKAGSDVLHVLFRILPALAPGVVVHFHDILWPFEYPAAWFREGRAWNEAYLIRALLQDSSTFEITYFGSYLEMCHPEPMRDALPLAMEKPSSPVTPGNSSLWLRKVR